MSDLIDREKAIEQMSLYGSVWMDYTDDMTKEQVAEKALRASKQALIEAVKRLPSAQPTFDVRDTQYNLPIGTDLISRQAAIDTLENTKTAISENGERYIAKQNAIMRIDALPSAQPDIIRCKDCKWWTKQEDSPQGRCALLQMYPTGGWFCGNARRREVTA